MENSTNTNSKPELLDRLPQIWMKFTYAIIIVAAVALVASVGYSLYDEEWSWFLYTLAACVFVMFPCAIIHLLVKIERNTRK